jgi:O-antigen/teichoic acid export membrane protein
LTSGLDLLIANIFIDAKAMGILAIVKVMPGFVSTLNYTIANVFTPSLIIDYAHSDTKEIVHTISQSAKLISVICTIPLAFLFVFGEEFYRLWQPTQDAKLLFILSTITIFGRVFFSGMQPLFNVFTVVNRVKENSLVTIVNGAIITLVTLVLVKYTDLGIYAVAGVSVFFCFLKNVLFVVPYSAKYLGLNKFAFMNTLTPSVLCTALLCVLGYVMKFFLPVDNWLHLIVAAVIFGVVGLAVSAYAVLSSSERQVLLSKLIHR